MIDKKWLMLVVSVVVCGFLFSGCAKSSCEDVCNACAIGGDCVDFCVNDYEDTGSSDCKKAFRDFAKCVDSEGCDDSCAAEATEWIDECDWAWY
jgi:hypothetical protein